MPWTAHVSRGWVNSDVGAMAAELLAQAGSIRDDDLHATERRDGLFKAAGYLSLAAAALVKVSSLAWVKPSGKTCPSWCVAKSEHRTCVCACDNTGYADYAAVPCESCGGASRPGP